MIKFETFISIKNLVDFMGLNWNFKVWGAVAVVVLLLSMSGAYLSTIEQENESVSILARVNNDGSGIFVKNSVTELTITDPNGWRGLIFMTPGPSSIQHMILSDIVKDMPPLKFAQWGTPGDSDTVFWTQMSPGNMLQYMFSESGSDIDGGIAWEPHYATAIADGRCKGIAVTSEYWPGHPCCVVAANNTFLLENEQSVERFLAGYSKSVDWILATLERDSSHPDYQLLLELTTDIGTPKTPSAAQMSQGTAINAMKNITYAYAIDDLAEQLAEVVAKYKSLGIVKENTLTDAGFGTPLDFTQHLIKGQYLAGVFNEDVLKSPEELGYNVGDHVATIHVAYLATDIHQMALHVGINAKLGFFSEYGVHVILDGPFPAGGDVMNALLSRHSDLGFVGSPPVVSSSVNALRS